MAAKSNSGNCIFNWFVCSFRNSFFLVMNIGASGYCSDFFSTVMLHTEKMSDEKRKATVEIVVGRFDNEKDKCTSLGICIILSESPNASKTTNIIVTVKKVQ